MTTTELPIFPRDLMAAMGWTHRNTLRQNILKGKVPRPDVHLTQKTLYWHRSTLVKAGLLAPVGAAATPPATNPPTPAASPAAQADTQPGCTRP